MLRKLFEYLNYYKCRVRSFLYRPLFKYSKGLMCWGTFELCNPSKLKVGENLTINYGVYINALGGIEIGNDVALSAGCKLISTGIDKSKISTMGHVSKKIIIGNNVQVGASAIILSGVEIGDNVIIGAGSVVTKNVSSNTVVAGVPAKIINII